MENKDLVTRVTVYMPKDLKEKLDVYCQEKHFSRSELCNFALKQFFADTSSMVDQTERMLKILEDENVRKALSVIAKKEVPDLNQLDFESLFVLNK